MSDTDRKYFYFAISVVYIVSMLMTAGVYFFAEHWVGQVLFWLIIGTNCLNLVKWAWSIRKVRSDEFVAGEIKFLIEENISHKQFCMTVVSLMVLCYPVIIYVFYTVEPLAALFIAGVEVLFAATFLYKMRLVKEQLFVDALKGMPEAKGEEI